MSDRLKALDAIRRGDDSGRLVALPSFDPLKGRIELTMAPGGTIADAVKLALPGLDASQHGRLRVTIGVDEIPQALWHRVRPKTWDLVLIRVIPGASDTFRTMLLIGVMIAAVAVGQVYLAPLIAGPLGFGAGTLATGLLTGAGTAALGIGGTLLVNALVPPAKPEEKNARSVFSIGGFQNTANPDGAVPQLAGGMRFAPQYAALPYSESTRSERFIIATFLLGNGPVDLSAYAPRLGLTPLDEFTSKHFGGVETLPDYQIEVREGYASDAPLTIHDKQVIEEGLSIELTHKAGKQTRFTARDVSEIEVEFFFAAGLFRQAEDERKLASVRIKIEYRLVGAVDWILAQSLVTTNNQLRAFWRTFRWTPAVRGQYEVQCTRLTEDGTSTLSAATTWSALRSFRPEYPFNYDKPMALITVRIQASGRLNGTLDNLNIFARRVCPDWDVDTQTWITRATSNPASIARMILQGPQNTFPAADAAIDLTAFQDWHVFCAAKGLTYNAFLTEDITRADAFTDVCRAGRALPLLRGDTMTIIIDRPRTQFYDHISPRNSWGLKESDAPVAFPDAYAVTFLDKDNNYIEARRIVPWPGFVGTPIIIEDLELHGVTDPDTVWIETRRRQYEAIYRRSSWTVSQDIEHLAITRGDAAFLAHPVIDRRQAAGRVRSIDGNRIEIDETVKMETGGTYKCRFRKPDGSTIERAVLTVAGVTQVLTLAAGAAPEVGDLAMFYSVLSPAVEVIVKSKETGENGTGFLTLIPHAPIIDTLTDAEEPPPWDSRVGDIIVSTVTVPAVPIITDIQSSQSVEDHDAVVLLEPGEGGATTASYDVVHRLAGTVPFTGLTVAVGEGAAFLDGYVYGDDIEVRARALSATGVPSAYTATSTHTIGEDDRLVPPIATFDANKLTEIWRLEWTIGAVEAGHTAQEVLGYRVRYAAGAWGAWDDLTALHSGLLTVSPWEISLPSADGVYTFGIVVVGDRDEESVPVLIYATAPDADVVFLTDAEGFFLVDAAGDFLTEPA